MRSVFLPVTGHVTSLPSIGGFTGRRRSDLFSQRRQRAGNFLTKRKAEWSPPANHNATAVNILFIFPNCPRGRALFFSVQRRITRSCSLSSLAFILAHCRNCPPPSARPSDPSNVPRRRSPPESLKLDYSGGSDYFGPFPQRGSVCLHLQQWIWIRNHQIRSSLRN